MHAKRPVVHKCVKKSIVSTKKCTDYLQISKNLCIFAPLSQWRMMVAAVGSTDILIILTKPIWFAGISQVSWIAKSWLMLVHICVLLLLYLRFRQCESLCEDTTKVVFFCIYIFANNNLIIMENAENPIKSRQNKK